MRNKKKFHKSYLVQHVIVIKFVKGVKGVLVSVYI